MTYELIGAKRIDFYGESRCAAASVWSQCARIVCVISMRRIDYGISMRGIERKRRTANGDVLSAFGIRRTIAYPLPFIRDDGLPGMDIERATLEFDAKHAFQHDRIFIEIRSLARLGPAGRAAHMGNAERLGIRINPSDVLIDEFRFRAGGGDARRLFNQRGRGRNFGAGMVHPMNFISAKDRTNSASFFGA